MALHIEHLCLLSRLTVARRPVKEAASKLHTALEDKDSPLIKFEPLIQG